MEKLAKEAERDSGNISECFYSDSDGYSDYSNYYYDIDQFSFYETEDMDWDLDSDMDDNNTSETELDRQYWKGLADNAFWNKMRGKTKKSGSRKNVKKVRVRKLKAPGSDRCYGYVDIEMTEG